MILDYQNCFSDAQAETTVAAHDSDNVIYVPDNIDRANCCILFQVVTTLTSDGAATMAIALLTDDNADFSSGTTLYTSAAIGYATLAQGYKLLIRSPRPIESYLKLTYTIAGAVLTAGAWDAHFITDPQTNSYLINSVGLGTHLSTSD